MRIPKRDQNTKPGKGYLLPINGSSQPRNQVRDIFLSDISVSRDIKMMSDRNIYLGAGCEVDGARDPVLYIYHKPCVETTVPIWPIPYPGGHGVKQFLE